MIFHSANTYLPHDKHEGYSYIRNLSENKVQACNLVTDSSGNNVGNVYFLIPVNDTNLEDVRLEKSQLTLERINKQLPEYHTWEMWRLLFQK